ncbi:MAG: heme d1 biosynthesis radical SAM protein NirJ [Defluviicoccus sp.]|nr:heme d1 biosynthesis radical SAM protein NirJ [Defluviicoccus sp.]MDG4608117.1 heme d1 biosynthesis radical SAM protein NirJ [Defluviicoccus sp.]
MFRISAFMAEIMRPMPLKPARRPAGPVVIWNLIRRCNLTCKHCYSFSADTDFAGELSTDEVFAVMADLRAFGVPVLILSGGEPLLRPDIFDITARAKALGFFVALSTNGTLIDAANIGQIAAAGYDYVGISLDGIGAVHDAIRRKEGAFAASLNAVRLCRANGIKVGLRFTMTLDNAHHLPDLLALADAEGVDKFYLSHLNYAGRGDRNRGADATFAVTRRAMEHLFEAALRSAENGDGKEYVTGNNDADGVFLLQWAQRRFPDHADHLRAKLVQWGGNSSGVNVANIDNLGNVHPDTFWGHHTLGNVRQRPFSAIWQDTSDPIMAGLKRVPRRIKGRCGACAHFDICGGNTRIRALRLTGDPWAADPGCYLTDAEIAGGAPADLKTDDPAFV